VGFGEIRFACHKPLVHPVLSATACQIPWHRQTAGGGIVVVERDSVVNIADRRRAIASWEAACNDSAADPAFQRGRGLITQSLRWSDRWALDQPQRGAVGEFAHLFGVDNAVAL